MSDWDGFRVSPALHRTVTELGGEAIEWVRNVPGLVLEIAREWELELGPALEHEGAASIIVPVTTDEGEAAILKLSVPHDESRHEADALARWGGDGAVEILRSSSDGFTLLLERCLPGHDLWRLNMEEQVQVMADLLPRLWVAPPDDSAYPELAGTAARWERQMERRATAMGLPAAVASRASGWARELSRDQPRRLLHGDFHPANVLAARRRPWLVIDPKPWVGDPAFDLAQTLANWIAHGVRRPALAPEAVRRQAEELAGRLSLDVDRVLRWAVVKAIGWDFGAETTLILDAAARRS